MNAETLLQIVLFVGFIIPVVGALWQVFKIREALSREIRENAHKIDLNNSEHKSTQIELDYRLKLMEARSNSLVDQLQLGIHQTKELVGHVRSRTTKVEESLVNQVNDIESFLEKTTEYKRRRSD